MDNVGCHGTEAKLTDCAYHTDTSEDSHSRDVWIDCMSESSSDASGIEQDIGLYAALVALTVSILVSIILFSYILCKRRSKPQGTGLSLFRFYSWSTCMNCVYVLLYKYV